jgi:hypothetical protein
MHLATAPTSLRATRVSVGLRAVLDEVHADREDLRVISVHRAVVNLVRRDGRLIAIADDTVGGLPDGILVGDGPDFTRSGIHSGMTARWAAGRLRIPDASLVIRTERAVDWSPWIRRRAVSGWPTRSERARALAREAHVPGGLRDLPTARPSLAALDAAVRARDGAGAADAACRLIGLGPGLTPSGDDALAGVESALHAAGHPLAGFLAAALDDVEARTTAVSVALLRHAAEGRVAERVHRLLDGLLASERAALAPTIELAVRHGATSGSDMLAGILLGLDAATGVATPRDAATGVAA